MVATATLASDTLTSWPWPVRARTRSAARIPRAAWRPVSRSQAGSTWLTGRSRSTGPVISGSPTSLLIGVHGRLAVAAPEDVDHDQVGPFGPQRLVVEPALAHGVGEQDAASGPRTTEQVDDQPAALVARRVQLHRALALVEPGPVEAVALLVEGQAAGVGGAAHRVDADDVRFHQLAVIALDGPAT